MKQNKAHKVVSLFKLRGFLTLPNIASPFGIRLFKFKSKVIGYKYYTHNQWYKYN